MGEKRQSEMETSSKAVHTKLRETELFYQKKVAELEYQQEALDLVKQATLCATDAKQKYEELTDLFEQHSGDYPKTPAKFQKRKSLEMTPEIEGGREAGTRREVSRKISAEGVPSASTAR